jgi:hypothetical protein
MAPGVDVRVKGGGEVGWSSWLFLLAPGAADPPTEGLRANGTSGGDILLEVMDKPSS